MDTGNSYQVNTGDVSTECVHANVDECLSTPPAPACHEWVANIYFQSDDANPSAPPSVVAVPFLRVCSSCFVIRWQMGAKSPLLKWSPSADTHGCTVLHTEIVGWQKISDNSNSPETPEE